MSYIYISLTIIYGRFLDMGPRSMVGHFTLSSSHHVVQEFGPVYYGLCVKSIVFQYRTIVLKLPNTMVKDTMLQYTMVFCMFEKDILSMSTSYFVLSLPHSRHRNSKKNLGKRYLIQGRTHQGIHLLAKSKLWRQGSEGITVFWLKNDGS